MDNDLTKVGCLNITNRALKQFALCSYGCEVFPDAVRISCKGGGCSGILFNLEFIQDTAIDLEEDNVFQIEDPFTLKFVIDVYSQEYLKDMQIDFISSLKETGFKFSGGTMKKTCGCGQSFSP